MKRNAHEYYELVHERLVNGKPVIKYAGFLGRFLNSKTDASPEQIAKYVSFLLKRGINQKEIDKILRKIEIDYDT